MRPPTDAPTDRGSDAIRCAAILTRAGGPNDIRVNLFSRCQQAGTKGRQASVHTRVACQREMGCVVRVSWGKAHVWGGSGAQLCRVQRVV